MIQLTKKQWSLLRRLSYMNQVIQDQINYNKSNPTDSFKEEALHRKIVALQAIINVIYDEGLIPPHNKKGMNTAIKEHQQSLLKELEEEFQEEKSPKTDTDEVQEFIDNAKKGIVIEDTAKRVLPEPPFTTGGPMADKGEINFVQLASVKEDETPLGGTLANAKGEITIEVHAVYHNLKGKIQFLGKGGLHQYFFPFADQERIEQIICKQKGNRPAPGEILFIKLKRYPELIKESLYLSVLDADGVEEDDFFTKETLYTASLDEVTTVSLPKFNPKPEMIRWGLRYFFWDKEAGVYREGMMYFAAL